MSDGMSSHIKTTLAYKTRKTENISFLKGNVLFQIKLISNVNNTCKLLNYSFNMQIAMGLV